MITCIKTSSKQNHLVQSTFQLESKNKHGKIFLKLIDTHFLPANNLRKIFNRNTVKVSYSCTQNASKIKKKRHNKKVAQVRPHD